ncbi:MAG: hypothetical protein ACOC1F_11510 [Myxococcota bacterium]
MRIEMPVETTAHFDKRAAQRGLSAEVLTFVLLYGREFPANGATSLTVLERDVPTALRASKAARESKGWVVVQESGFLLTCYRRREPSRFLRRKNKLPGWARPCRPGGATA